MDPRELTGCRWWFPWVLLMVALVPLPVDAEPAASSSQLILKTERILRIDPHPHGPTDPDPPHSDWYFVEMTVPKDMVVTGYHVAIDGAPPTVLHHMALFRRDQRHSLCDSYGSHQELVTVAQNRATERIDFAPPYGVVLEKGTPLLAEVMTHHADRPYGPGGTFEDVGFSVVLDYQPLDETDRDRPVKFFRLRLDDTPCATPHRHEAFSVPPKTEDFVRSGRGDVDGKGPGAYVFRSAGTILKLGANLWVGKGGQAETVFINDKPIHRFVPELMDPSDPWSWRIPIWQDANHRVSAGDTLTFDAVYSNPHDEPIMDATGQLLVFFAPDDPLAASVQAPVSTTLPGTTQSPDPGL